MATASPNFAAWTDALGAQAVIRPSAMPSPDSSEVMIRVKAIALNPVDPMLAKYGLFTPQWPFIFGFDVAGEVIAVGADVPKGIQPGDRVTALMDGMEHIDPTDPSKQQVKVTNTGFQHYTATTHTTVAKIPDNVSFAQASVLPLAMSTAASGLFEKDKLALDHPKPVPEPKDQWVFVYGGSSSVGSCAIQLAVSAGYKVATACGPKNFDYVKQLGAEQVFSAYSKDLVAEAVAALKGKHFAGVYEAIGAIGGDQQGAFLIGVELAKQLDGDRALASVFPDAAQSKQAEGLRVSGIFASTIRRNEVAKAVFHDYVHDALANGSLQCKPEPSVIGSGLEKVQEAMDTIEAGVSAKKIVIEL